MCRQHARVRWWAIIVALLIAIAWGTSGCGPRPPQVEIVVNPSISTLEVGERLALAANAVGQELKYQWTLAGPGQLLEPTTDPAVVYEATGPGKVVVTVEVTDKKDQMTTKSYSFVVEGPTEIVERPTDTPRPPATLPPTTPPSTTPPPTTPPPTTPPVTPMPDAVIVAPVNLRSGPGTVYDIIGTLRPNQVLTVTGRIADTTWLQVITDQMQEGWVVNWANLVTLNLPTERISVVSPPPPPTEAPAPACPPADAEGTVPPAVAISSIIFIVNGTEQVVRGAESLQASPGDQMRVREVTICPIDPFGGSGGQVYVEFDPVDQNGQVIASEVRGTQAVEVTPGFTTIPGPDYTWSIGDNWRHISVVTVHYPPGGGTQNPECEGGACEVDDRVIVHITAVLSTITPVIPTDTPVPPTPMSACPPVNAEGTVPPSVAISSITFIVNGTEQVVRDADALQASPGDQVQVSEVTICPVEPFEGGGGQVYVEFDPVDQNGQVIASEVKGTQAVGVTPGFTAIPGRDAPWTIGNWRHISVVTVHYPPGGGTQNPSCEGGACEVDDRVIVRLQ